MKRIVLSAVIALAAFGISTNAMAQNEVTTKAHATAQKVVDNKSKVANTVTLQKETAQKNAECCKAKGKVDAKAKAACCKSDAKAAQAKAACTAGKTAKDCPKGKTCPQKPGTAKEDCCKKMTPAKK